MRSTLVRRIDPNLTLAVALVLVSLTPATARAQTVRGIVSEASTETPISLSSVSAINRAGQAVSTVLTDERGYFELTLPDDGLYVLRATALGYRAARTDSFEIEDAGSQVLYLSLTPEPVEIDGLVVRTEGEAQNGRAPSLADRGFYERLASGRGQFLTPGHVLASDAFFTSQLFEGLDGVHQDYSVPAWQRGIRYRSATERGNCNPRVFIDGIPQSYLMAEGLALSDIAPLEDVLAVEVFWGPFQAPMKYQGTMVDNSCGVVLFWTKSRTRL